MVVDYIPFSNGYGSCKEETVIVKGKRRQGEHPLMRGLKIQIARDRKEMLK